jgi:hypothetical protein
MGGSFLKVLLCRWSKQDNVAFELINPLETIRIYRNVYFQSKKEPLFPPKEVQQSLEQSIPPYIPEEPMSDPMDDFILSQQVSEVSEIEALIESVLKAYPNGVDAEFLFNCLPIVSKQDFDTALQNVRLLSTMIHFVAGWKWNYLF